MPRTGRAFNTTKIPLKDFPEEVQQTIEQMFITLEAAKSDAVGAQRAAVIAVNKARTKIAAAQTAEIEIIAAAAHHKQPIECETQWTVYRNSKGEITFEGLTERVMRNTGRAALQQLGKQAEEMSSGSGLDLYENEDEENGHHE